MSVDRRRFTKLAGLSALATGLGLITAAQASPTGNSPDYTLRIGNGLVELAPDKIVSTTTFNGQFPGPLLRLKQGREVVVDIFNDTDTPEQLHWHGLRLPTNIDGAAEEGTPYIPAHGSRRIAFTPDLPGLRFYHSHLRAGADLSLGQYSGQVGPLYIEPRDDPGRYDQEVFLTLKEFEPSFSRGGDMDMDFLAPAIVDQNLKSIGERAMKESLDRGMPHGFEVGYEAFSINGRMLGHGEPIHVRPGERVLFHVLNGSAGEIRSLALPGHSFRVLALDGNPVPKPVEVPVLWLGTAERVSALVEMNNPGVWILGDLADDDRTRGMGLIVEYAGEKGAPRWAAPARSSWNYTRFGVPQTSDVRPDEIIELTFAKNNAAIDGFNQWTINGLAFSDMDMKPMAHLHEGRRYRLRLSNASDDIHPIHLHRHSFELSNIAGTPTGGVIKDVFMLGGYQTADIDFLADNPGLTLFHCHQQLHMDFGFMALFDYI